MSHNPTSNTLSTWVNSLLVLLTSQGTLTMATLHQEAHIHLSIVITVGNQHPVPSSHWLIAHITLGSNQISTPMVL